jgi:protein-tyrosine-phosphatase
MFLNNCPLSPFMRVLFVCRANTGRSQMAEALFNKITGLKSFSAGTKVDIESQKIIDRGPLVEPVIRFMKKEGIDVSENVRNQLSENMLKNFDKVVVMAEPENIPEYLINNPKVEFWEIKDPKGMNDKGFEEIISQLKKKIYEFVKVNKIKKK